MSDDNFVLHPLISQLLAARKARGLSQKDLGNKLDAAQSYVARIEKGETDLRTSNLIQMARLLGLEVMLVPIGLVPAVTAIVMGKDSPTAGLENEPLYELSGEVEDDE